MKQVKCFVDENAPIALMELTKIEVRPSMTLEDIRESHPKTYNDIVDRIKHFKEHTCTTRKENDYNDSYKKWLEQKLDEYTGVMDAASTLHAYMLANEQRRVCIEELKRIGAKVQPLEIPECLQTGEARAVLSVLEGVSVKVKGKGTCRVLDTTTSPWSYASKAALHYVAKCVGNILNIQERWHVFELACGVKNLRSVDRKEPIEVYNALIAAGYTEFDI